MQKSGLKENHTRLKGVIPVDKRTLNQYRALIKEIPKIKSDITKLERRLAEVPIVAGKVEKSSDEFPYIQGHVTVEMAEPKLATEIKNQIRLKEMRLDKTERDKTAIEQFIAGIDDSTDRMIFELLYLSEKRMSQTKVGDMVGYDQSSVSLKIKKYLKDS